LEELKSMSVFDDDMLIESIVNARAANRKYMLFVRTEVVDRTYSSADTDGNPDRTQRNNRFKRAVGNILTKNNILLRGLRKICGGTEDSVHSFTLAGLGSQSAAGVSLPATVSVNIDPMIVLHESANNTDIARALTAKHMLTRLLQQSEPTVIIANSYLDDFLAAGQDINRTQGRTNADNIYANIIVDHVHSQVIPRALELEQAQNEPMMKALENAGWNVKKYSLGNVNKKSEW
jgi:hypothetical protein